MPLFRAASHYFVNEIIIGMMTNASPIFPTNMNATRKHLPYDQFENMDEFKDSSFLSVVKIQ